MYAYVPDTRRVQSAQDGGLGLGGARLHHTVRAAENAVLNREPLTAEIRIPLMNRFSGIETVEIVLGA
ncbi:MAG: hypothetical protein U1E06_13755 [Tabrizicola sp.]|nr:hypothetical protein [Tabrizicola sp.]